jgi:hypothetical protein
VRTRHREECVRRTSEATGSTSTRDARKTLDGRGGPGGPHQKHDADQRGEKTVPRASREVLDHSRKAKPTGHVVIEAARS